jgi:hypothetical protein
LRARKPTRDAADALWGVAAEWNQFLETEVPVGEWGKNWPYHNFKAFQGGSVRRQCEAPRLFVTFWNRFSLFDVIWCLVLADPARQMALPGAKATNQYSEGLV